MLLFFPEATPQRSPNLAGSLPFPQPKGGVNTSSARLCFCGLHAPNIHVGFASSSQVAPMRRLIHPWTVFPATCQSSILRSTFGTASYRQLAGSGTFRRAHIVEHNVERISKIVLGTWFLTMWVWRKSGLYRSGSLPRPVSSCLKYPRLRYSTNSLRTCTLCFLLTKPNYY
jgi:hypothetical protein